jgi:hypothetical protein
VAWLKEMLGMSRDSSRAMRRDTGADLSSQTVRVCPPPIPLARRTAGDAIVWACPPPVMQVRIDVGEAIGTASQGGFKFQIEVDRPHREHGQDSTGWLSSFTLHAVLFVLLAMLLSPADFGGIDSRPIYLSFARDDLIEPAATFETPELENQAADEPLPIDDPQPVEAPQDDAAESADSLQSDSGLSASDGAGAAGGDSAAHGAFFGIEAHGHEFVYVLDMSGSMSGSRYRRASDELVRSVEGLGPAQSFYVLLFDNTTVQMFNNLNKRPIPLAATRANKDKLAYWLEKAYRGGNTDPRGALSLALRMNPSAIFMLSDGKFTKPKKTKTRDLFDSNSDAFSIVADAHADVPIHAIAFEDPRSRDNMKRLADMTQGEYRFIKSADEEFAKDRLARARHSIQCGNRATAVALLRNVVKAFADTDSAAIARKELTATLFEMGSEGIEQGRLEIAKQSLAEMISLDPEAESTDGFQQQLVEKLLQRTNDRDSSAELGVLTEIVNRFPRSATAQRIVAPLADAILKEARKLAANNQPEQAIQKLETVLKEYPLLPATRECRMEQQQIIDQLLARATAMRTNQDIVASAIYLRGLLDLDVHRMNQLATRALERLAAEAVAGIRDANRQRDLSARNELQRQLDEGFGNHETLQRMQRDMGRRELKARDLLRRASRTERISTVETAIGEYAHIVDNYWGTISAEKAASRLELLQPKQKRSAAGKESWELLDMVQP